MSKFHDFYQDVEGVSATILWTIWCSNSPVPVDKILEETDASESTVYRELLYFSNCSILYPIEYNEQIAFVYNPIVEWVSAVSELVRNNTRDELEMQLREAEAGVEMYQELHGTETIDEYVEKTETAPDDAVEWILDDVKTQWIADAIEYYNLFERFQPQHKESITDIATVEKEFVRKWDEAR